MTAQDVEEMILRPMLALYPPPHHLRHDAARAAALDAYTHALSAFDCTTLGNAWRQVVAAHALWVWPNPGLIADACRRLAPKPVAGAADAQFQRAQEMAEAYARDFLKNSKLARLARAEGWEPTLRAYLVAAAWVQAQYLVGTPAVGYDSPILFGYPRQGPRECQRQAEVFLEKARAQAERGFLRVSVPNEMIQFWKKQIVSCQDQGQAQSR